MSQSSATRSDRDYSHWAIVWPVLIFFAYVVAIVALWAYVALA